jgi:D-arabinose 1-dehydrogenase-like Zn-dependent alcohol dehydrogenase
MSAAASSSAAPAPLPHRPTKTVLVLGASYAGHRAIQMLLAQLPADWRVVVLERNTHANHLYAFPRVAVVKGHEEKVSVVRRRRWLCVGMVALWCSALSLCWCCTCMSLPKARSAQRCR